MKEAIDPAITYAPSFEQWLAAHAASLDLWEWDHGTRYSPDFKAKVLAFYRLRNLVDLHVEDAKAAALRRHRGKR